MHLDCYKNDKALNLSSIMIKTVVFFKWQKTKFLLKFVHPSRVAIRMKTFCLANSNTEKSANFSNQGDDQCSNGRIYEMDQLKYYTKLTRTIGCH